jgi:ketosteroid isomerase-like protein
VLLKGCTRHRAGAAAIVVAIVALVIGCAPDKTPDVAPPRTASASLASDTSPRARPGYVIDSVLPVDEELRRFRVGLERAPTSFDGGAPSRETLVRHFFSALARADSAELRDMLLSRPEFAYLVYPESPYTHPPYRQPPELVWMQLATTGSTGVRRLLARARDYQYVSHRCDATPEREGTNTLWRQCRARVVRSAGDTVNMRLFGVIVERDGRFKFASYETDF